MTKNNRSPSDQDKLIIFPLNELEYIFIELPYKDIDSLDGFEHPSDNLPWFYHGPNNLTLRIAGGCIGWIDFELDKFIAHLQSALDGNIELDSTKISSLGAQWNEYLYYSTKSIEEWEGRKYLCLSDIKVETFIYTINKAIYLEIIPAYPWLFGNKPKGLKKVPFKQFIKNYKPFVRTVISRDAAHESLEKASFLRNIIDRNQQVFHESQKPTRSYLDNRIGQIALDRAIRIDELGKMLISPDKILSAMFYAKRISQSSSNSYHGFALDWEQEWPKLTKQAKETLINSAICDHMGNILSHRCINQDTSPGQPQKEGYCPSCRVETR